MIIKRQSAQVSLNIGQLIGQACLSRGCPRLKQPLPADINARYLPIRQEGLGEPEAVISISAGGVEPVRGPAAEGFKWKRRYGGSYGLLGKAVHGRGRAGNDHLYSALLVFGIVLLSRLSLTMAIYRADCRAHR